MWTEHGRRYEVVHMATAAPGRGLGKPQVVYRERPAISYCLIHRLIAGTRGSALATLGCGGDRERLLYWPPHIR